MLLNEENGRRNGISHSGIAITVLFNFLAVMFIESDGVSFLSFDGFFLRYFLGFFDSRDIRNPTRSTIGKLRNYRVPFNMLLIIWDFHGEQKYKGGQSMKWEDDDEWWAFLVLKDFFFSSLPDCITTYFSFPVFSFVFSGFMFFGWEFRPWNSTGSMIDPKDGMTIMEHSTYVVSIRAFPYVALFQIYGISSYNLTTSL